MENLKSVLKNDYFLGSATFAVGCLLFTADAIQAKPLNVSILTGCIFFDIGCLFFLKDALRKES